MDDHTRTTAEKYLRRYALEHDDGVVDHDLESRTERSVTMAVTAGVAVQALAKATGVPELEIALLIGDATLQGQVLAVEQQEADAAAEEIRQARRQVAARQVSRGASKASVAKTHQISRPTLDQWLVATGAPDPSLAHAARARANGWRATPAESLRS